MFATSLSVLSLLPWLFGATTIQSYICQPPVRPVIVAPAQNATVTSGEVVISGTATASSQVTLSIDGTDALQLTAAQDNTFLGQLNLTAGQHTLGITSVNPCGNNTGDPVTVTAVAPPPIPIINPPPVTSPGGGSTVVKPVAGLPAASAPLTVIITNPATGFKTSKSWVFLQGGTNKPALVSASIGGKTYGNTLISGTSYGMSIPLQPGDNVITVRATSGSETATTVIHVMRTVEQSASAPPYTFHLWWLWLIIAILIVCIVVLGLMLWFITR